MSYRESIIKDTGCTHEEAAEVEDIMRNDIFHSTLDWQTHAEFKRGAREAYEVYKALHSDVCLQCGTPEVKTDLGGVTLSNLAPYSRLCPECIRKELG